MAELKPQVEQAMELLRHPVESHQLVQKTILIVLWRLAENVAIVTHWQHALHEQIEELESQLEAIMPADTTKMNQNYADAKSNVVQLAAAHGTSSTEAQAIADDAANKFADLRDTAKVGLPADTTPGGTGGDTTGGTASPETPATPQP